MDKRVVLEIENLYKYFPYERNFFGKTKSSLQAVDNISFKLYEGETLSIVGESGCGKSTLAKTILKIHKKDKGNVKLEDRDLENLKGKELKKMRKNIQMVFQDPYSSLDPSMKIRDILKEGIIEQKIVSKEKVDKKIEEVCALCGLRMDWLTKYPKEFSGGMRQRVCIARAISLEPKVMVLDEPVSALDVSMQAQIINLLIDLKEKEKMSYIFISHDLSLVKYISDRVCVMYLGSIVEIGEKDEIYKNPKHPYTKALMEAIPISHPKYRKEKKVLEGEVPSAINPPKGCKFSTRCPYVMDKCKNERPELKGTSDKHRVACFLED